MAEMALAHFISDKVGAAYRRGNQFERRRQMLEAGAEFVSTVERPAKMIDMKTKRTIIGTGVAQ